MSEKTIYDCERAKFEGFGTYKLPIEERVNEIMEATKKEYPNVDNYLLWLCAVDYVLEEKGLKKDNDDGVKMYEEYIKERKIFIYNTVKVQDDDVIKYDCNVLQEVRVAAAMPEGHCGGFGTSSRMRCGMLKRLGTRQRRPDIQGYCQPGSHS